MLNKSNQHIAGNEYDIEKLLIKLVGYIWLAFCF